jgi:hypothetical protein
VISSHLSDILEEDPDPKYTLSAKACLGILTRASRRGKKLPQMLEEALIQTVVEETDYGQKGIADTIEILREMRSEIGEEALEEWVQRTFVLVQSEEVLLSEVCEPCEDSEDSNEQVLVEGDGEESIREASLCEMRGIGEAGDSPQRREPTEQLSEQLELLMQKLPYENAPKAIILYCMRIACQSEEPMSEALSAVSQGKNFGADDRLGADQYNAVILGDTVSALGVNCGMSHGRQCVLEPIVYDGSNITSPVNASTAQPGDPCHTLSTDSRNLLVQLKGTGAMCYSVDQGGGKSACNVKEGQSPTLTCTHGGEPVVCYEATRYIVRRLTPLECERLQGYPDGWTDIGEYIDTNGKKRQTSDAARYKALGNSIALPPWKWVLKRICACYERDATIASLFDGIGGFPFLWEQLNGKGTCLWASEIEEFPIAVTKARIK